MPSDPRCEQVLERLAEPIEAFESAVATAAEEVRRFLLDMHGSTEDHRRNVTAGLGMFGEAHVNPDRFVALLNHAPATDRVTAETVERALATLDEMAKTSRESCLVRTEPGADLRTVVERALARAGRAFGAAHVAQAAKMGQNHLNDHARSLGSFPFSKWNASERGAGPPLVIEVDGNDLRAGGLSEYLDGRQKIVLVIRGTCSPAPLVRLISPRTFVVQADTVEGLDAFAGWDGPGVAALVPEGCARFVHDPAGGSATSDRVTIDQLPENKPRKAIAGLSAAQQAEELALLATLAAPSTPAGRPAAAAEGATAAVAAAAEAPVEPVDKLAAWLLSQADLSDLE